MTTGHFRLRMQPQAAIVSSRAGRLRAEANDPETSAQLIAAHESAVVATLAHVEDEAIRVRGHASADVQPGDGVIAAAYRHRMSRSLDPQLHTHVVCANIARGPGRWTALDARAIYQHARTAGFLYQAHLRAEVCERLGWQWGPVANGAAELTHVAPGVLSEFSRRRHEITSAAELVIADHLAGATGLTDTANAFDERDALRVFAAAAAVRWRNSSKTAASGRRAARSCCRTCGC